MLFLLLLSRATELARKGQHLSWNWPLIPGLGQSHALYDLVLLFDKNTCSFPMSVRSAELLRMEQYWDLHSEAEKLRLKCGRNFETGKKWCQNTMRDRQMRELHLCVLIASSPKHRREKRLRRVPFYYVTCTLVMTHTGAKSVFTNTIDSRGLQGMEFFQCTNAR